MDDQQPQAADQQPTMPVCSGLSGNEMYCAALLGLRPGQLCVGNSVFSMGVLGGLRSNIKTVIGGEIHAFTDMVQQGRSLAFDRLQKELTQVNGQGVTGVTSELVFHGNNVEFLSIGSAVISETTSAGSFTTSADGQELFCQVDAGYQPISFVFGNVAYSIGIGGHILGNIRQLGKGEVHSYSDIFNETRNLALQRIVKDAQSVNANAVIGIETTILPYGTSGVHEMVMIGTASQYPLANEARPGGVITSDLTAEETWNITKMGYMPLELVLGTSVYSLGVVGGFSSALKGMVHGEINALTQMIYGAREESIGKLQKQAAAVNADDVLGIKTYIYQLGGDLIELLAIGTAVKRVSGINTRSQQLPPQAIITDKNTFLNTAETHYGVDLNTVATN
jgi:uncharacterized protein YbjQ (UPF0145 family)